MHALAGTPGSLFIPAAATVLWFFASKKIFAQRSHCSAILYFRQAGVGQLVFVAVVVFNLVNGQTTRSYCSHWTCFQADPR
jgi:hypothetical protein